MRSYRRTFQGALEISERQPDGYWLEIQYFWTPKKTANKLFTRAKREREEVRLHG